MDRERYEIPEERQIFKDLEDRIQPISQREQNEIDNEKNDDR